MDEEMMTDDDAMWLDLPSEEDIESYARWYDSGDFDLNLTLRVLELLAEDGVDVDISILEDDVLSKGDKPLNDPKGGLTAAGRKAFGGNLRPGVKNYGSASDADKKRWVSWALRFYGQSKYPPLTKPNGEPTRFALTAAAWGEPVPKTEADARKIAAKARRRSEELKRKEEKS
jgi:hypothetical protein